MHGTTGTAGEMRRGRYTGRWRWKVSGLQATAADATLPIPAGALDACYPPPCTAWRRLPSSSPADCLAGGPARHNAAGLICQPFRPIARALTNGFD